MGKADALFDGSNAHLLENAVRESYSSRRITISELSSKRRDVMDLTVAKNWIRDNPRHYWHSPAAMKGTEVTCMVKELVAEVERLTERDKRITAQMKQSCEDARAAQPYDGEVMRCEELVNVESERDRYKKVYLAAKGLTTGYDWNNGTHAKIYRPQLIEAVDTVDAAETIHL